MNFNILSLSLAFYPSLPSTDSVATDDADYVEVGTGEVCYKKAAGGAHELLEAAEHKIQELQNDIQQYAGKAVLYHSSHINACTYYQLASHVRSSLHLKF